MDTIHISNLIIYAHHGVAEEEQTLGQRFQLDAAIFLDAGGAAAGDDLSLTVNYGEVCRFFKAEMEKQKDRLIEKVCARLAESLLLSFPLIRKVSLEVKKPWAPIGLPLDYAAVSMERAWHKAYIGAGSNLGDREAYLKSAMESLAGMVGIRDLKEAPVIETEPAGYTDQPDFLNTVYEIETWYSPYQLLKILQELENKAGRTREIHWGPRTLDLDLLIYDDLITEDPVLVLPHPLMHRRKFVLEPLCRLNPWGVHPLYRKRFCDLLEDLEKGEE